jgi:streptogramin lyase
MPTQVEPNIRWTSPGDMPNGLQATADGLWVIDQIDPNDIYLLAYEDGSVLRKIPTRAIHSSGITIDPTGNIWVASTFTYELICFDPNTGSELLAHPTPPYDRSGGAHGTEWRDGKLWFNVPKTGRIFAMDPTNGQIVHSIPCHGDRAHGIAWDPRDASLWSVDTNRRVIYKLNPLTGQILEAVGVAGPEPHGMTIWQGEFWMCDAESRAMFSFPLPPASGPS